MTVKELIAQLLDCNLENNFDIDIETKEEDISVREFEISGSGSFTTLTINPVGYVLVGESEVREMQDTIDELKANNKELQDEINAME